MFYVPRTLILDELFDIVSKIKGTNRIFFDVHILKSANKIKALLIIFGYNIEKKIDEGEIEDYLRFIYHTFNITDKQIKILSAIAKIIGNFRFLENEIFFRKSLENREKYKENSVKNIINFNSDVITVDDIGKELYNFFYKSILTEQDKIKLKSLNCLKESKINKNSQINFNDNLNINNNNSNKYFNVNNNSNQGNYLNNKVNKSFSNLSIDPKKDSYIIKPNINIIKENNNKTCKFIKCNEISLGYFN
jgi:hypothetical protein